MIDNTKIYKLIQIFSDTQNFYTTDYELKQAVHFSMEHTKLYGANDYPDLPDITNKLGLTLTLNLRSFQTAIKFKKVMPNKKIAVLNFASATHPGGGVVSGSTAQEESLCRCSTLYPAINQQWLKNQFYIPNQQAHDFRYNDSCIYSEDIVICKSDIDYPERLQHDNFVKVDVISCAAPNLRQVSTKDYDIKEIFKIHTNRARHILHIVAAHNVDILITGAFGCGAFKNNPELVADAWKKAIEDYKNKFDFIIFAIYSRGNELNNFTAFNEKL